jgi:uncharacterized protein (DUF2384 family)
MAKKIKNYTTNEGELNIVNEPMIDLIVSPNAYTTIKTSVKDYTFNDFKKVMAKINFTLAEWADLLCISERTLQRYSKSNAAFNGLQIERILLLDKMLVAGNGLFGKNLESWLKKPSIKYNGSTPFSQLFSYSGIESVINYIGQLEWGVVA